MANSDRVRAKPICLLNDLETLGCGLHGGLGPRLHFATKRPRAGGMFRAEAHRPPGNFYQRTTARTTASMAFHTGSITFATIGLRKSG